MLEGCEETAPSKRSLLADFPGHNRGPGEQERGDTRVPDSPPDPPIQKQAQLQRRGLLGVIGRRRDHLGIVGCLQVGHIVDHERIPPQGADTHHAN